jgi:cytochrome P450 family 110
MSRMKLPDGPKTLPILQIIQEVVNPLGTLEKNFQKYGDWYTARYSGLGTTVMLNKPEAIESVMTAPSGLFDSGEANAFFKPFLGSHSMVVLDGKAHQRERKLLASPFHGERLKTYSQDICEITRRATEFWQPRQNLSIRKVTQDISLRVMMTTVLGVYEGVNAEQLAPHLDKFLKFFDRPENAAFMYIPALQKDWGAWSPWGKVIRQLKKIDRVIFTEIQERRANPERLGDDILSLMMMVQDEEGQSMTDWELRDEMITLLFVGHETTATAIAWVLYWIHYLPEVGQKLYEELDKLEGHLDPMTISRLPYLSAVCNESLRIYPVVPFTLTRVLKRPWTLMDQNFEPGTQFGCCIYLLHRRPDLYPEPDQFRPERFLERQYSPYEYMPFGGGNRRCLGKAFALFEMKLVLTSILTQWKLELQSNHPIKPVCRGVTVAPQQGVPMRVVGRRN